MFFRNKESNIVVAVEAGTQSVITAVAELNADGKLYLLAVGEAKSNGIRKGEVVDYQLALQSVRDSIIDAENKSDTEINEVYLSLTGSHVSSRRVLVKTNIEEEDNLISNDHINQLEQLARQQAIPRDHALVLELLQHYYLDGQTICEDPIGLNSNVLEASYLLVHGLHTRLESSVRTIIEQDIDVSGYALASYATAQSILDKLMKQQGSVVVDIGAGSTDYIVYANGAVVHTGVIGVGGDHVTQDLAIGLKIPYDRAEELKISYGDLYVDGYSPGEKILLERDLHMDEKEISRNALAQISYVRIRELFEIINSELEEKEVWPHVTGHLYLTGGCSKLCGIVRLANEVFPVKTKLGEITSFEGDQIYKQRPELATALGLLIYARQVELNNRKVSGWDHIRRSFSEVMSAMKML